MSSSHEINPYYLQNKGLSEKQVKRAINNLTILKRIIEDQLIQTEADDENVVIFQNNGAIQVTKTNEAMMFGHRSRNLKTGK